MAAFWLCPHMAQREQALWCLHLSGHWCHHEGPNLMILSKLNYLLKVPFPHTIVPGAKASTHEFWRETAQYIAPYILSIILKVQLRSNPNFHIWHNSEHMSSNDADSVISKVNIINYLFLAVPWLFVSFSQYPKFQVIWLMSQCCRHMPTCLLQWEVWSWILYLLIFPLNQKVIQVLCSQKPPNVYYKGVQIFVFNFSSFFKWH